MGCHKIPYQGTQDTNPFLGVWKEGHYEKLPFLKGVCPAKKEAALKKRDSYYPFGATINSLSSTAPLSKPNKFKYNGKELNEEFDLDWYSYGAREYDPQIGRFFTQDRFAEKYLEFSPYQYGANNPIKYIDVNGDSLWIQTGKNSRALYQDGQLLNADGSQYTGKGTKTDKNGNVTLTGFLKTTVADLDKISSGKVGNSIIDEAQSSSSSLIIEKGSNGNKFGTSPGVARVEFDPSSSQGGLNELGNKDRPTYIGLFHEVAHGVDALRGTISQKHKTIQPGNSVNDAEIFASHLENQVRAEQFLPLRTHYGSQQILNSSGQGIHFNNYDYRGAIKAQLPPVRSLVPATLPRPVNLKGIRR